MVARMKERNERFRSLHILLKLLNKYGGNNNSTFFGSLYPKSQEHGGTRDGSDQFKRLTF